MTLLVFLLVALASFRLWRLLGRDDITSFMRSPLPPYALKGVTCPWCFGSHLAIVITVLTHLFVYDLVSGSVLSRAGFVALICAAVAGAVGLIAERLDP